MVGSPGQVEAAILNGYLDVNDVLGILCERLHLSTVGTGAVGIENHLNSVGKVDGRLVVNLLCYASDVLGIPKHEWKAISEIEETRTSRHQRK